MFKIKHIQTPPPFTKHLCKECQNEKFLFHQNQSILIEILGLKKLFSSRINVLWYDFLKLLIGIPEFYCVFYSSCPHDQIHAWWWTLSLSAVSGPLQLSRNCHRSPEKGQDLSYSLFRNVSEKQDFEASDVT